MRLLALLSIGNNGSQVIAEPFSDLLAIPSNLVADRVFSHGNLPSVPLGCNDWALKTSHPADRLNGSNYGGVCDVLTIPSQEKVHIVHSRQSDVRRIGPSLLWDDP